MSLVDGEPGAASVNKTRFVTFFKHHKRKLIYFCRRTKERSEREWVCKSIAAVTALVNRESNHC